MLLLLLSFLTCKICFHVGYRRTFIQLITGCLCTECVAVCSVHGGGWSALWLGGRQAGCDSVVCRDGGRGVAGSKTPHSLTVPHGLHSTEPPIKSRSPSTKIANHAHDGPSTPTAPAPLSLYHSLLRFLSFFSLALSDLFFQVQVKWENTVLHLLASVQLSLWRWNKDL